MSDIFISYSKADHALALKLSAFLEAEGWSVWWDKSLAAADLYRDEIMKQLVAARAVITIWTENSVKSDWVRAEAGRAKADGKLIPVKTADVAYADIPLPFGEMHTENVASTELIRAAVVAQLARPTIPKSQLWQITGIFKYQVLTWVGIVGSVITLFANLNGILDLADWARELVVHWHEWTRMAWGWVFNLIGLRVPRVFVPMISFIASVGLLVAGVNLSARHIQPPDRLQLAIPSKVIILIAGIVFYTSIFIVILGNLITVFEVGFLKLIAAGFWVGLKSLVGLLLFLGIPVAYLACFVEQRWSWLVVNSLLFLCMACLLLLPTVSGYSTDNEGIFAVRLLSAFLLLEVGWMAVILFSPVKQLTRRLGFVVLGVLTLVALSEISKFNLHQYLQPPRVSDSSIPAQIVGLAMGFRT
jgi:hypothetical protein